MIILTFSNGKYSYNKQASESEFNENECLLYSHNALGKDKQRVVLYDGRVEVHLAGGEWGIYKFYILTIDGVTITSGLFFSNYNRQWSFGLFGIETLVDYLNVIEDKGIDYVFDQYEKIIREDYQRVLDIKPFLESFCKGYRPSTEVLYSFDVSHNLQKLLSEHDLLREKIRNIEIAKLLRNK